MLSTRYNILTNTPESLLKNATAIMEAIKINTTDWELKFKREPKGNGKWVFWWEGKDGANWYEASGDYKKVEAEAIKKAKVDRARKIDLLW